jgi:hypothetical protein
MNNNTLSDNSDFAFLAIYHPLPYNLQ